MLLRGKREPAGFLTSYFYPNRSIDDPDSSFHLEMKDGES